MRSLEDALSHYAAFHRDPRNIATHLVGIPLIVAAVAALLARPALNVAAIAVTPALLVAAALAAYYVKLDLVLGAIMALLLLAALTFGEWAASLPTSDWLLAGFGIFVFGWTIQFVGHAFEGKKPAFADDLIGFAVGPLFVLCEALFLLGLRPRLKHAIESRAGPVRRRTSAST